MKEKFRGLCGDCLNLSKRVIKTHGDVYSYKAKGQKYDRKHSCIKGHEVWSHQPTVKCSHHRPRKKRV